MTVEPQEDEPYNPSELGTDRGWSADARQVELDTVIQIRNRDIDEIKTTPFASSNDLLLPERFELLGELGKGGMGVVYQARNRFTSTIVAIKMIDGANADSAEAQRLLREAQAASSIKHSGAASILDFGIHQEKPYLVMECLPGVTLEKYLKQEPKLDDKTTAAIANDVCNVLEAAHAASVIHRDLKPSNIMIDRDQSGMISAKVLDFGLAKIIDLSDRQALTQTGEVLGTPLYMSPEQCIGKKVDQRSDIYSFGALLYHCLTGYPAFKGETVYATIYKKLNESPAPFKSFGIQSELEGPVRKCLEVAPEDRYQSVSELQAD